MRRLTAPDLELRQSRHARLTPVEQHGQNDVGRCDAANNFDTIILAASTGTSFGELVGYNVS